MAVAMRMDGWPGNGSHSPHVGVATIPVDFRVTLA
jgi:hypothetical protein